jgi:hypothetical protein
LRGCGHFLKWLFVKKVTNGVRSGGSESYE